MMSAAPVLAADDIEVNEDISVSGDYDWKRLCQRPYHAECLQHGLYISDGSDESINVLSAFEELTGIKVNYTTYDSNESLYAKLKSGGVSYDVIFPSDSWWARWPRGYAVRAEHGQHSELCRHR